MYVWALGWAQKEQEAQASQEVQALEYRAQMLDYVAALDGVHVWGVLSCASRLAFEQHAEVAGVVGALVQKALRGDLLDGLSSIQLVELLCGYPYLPAQQGAVVQEAAHHIKSADGANSLRLFRTLVDRVARAKNIEQLPVAVFARIARIHVRHWQVFSPPSLPQSAVAHMHSVVYMRAARVHEGFWLVAPLRCVLHTPAQRKAGRR